jgi:hypothetical protein
MRRGYLSGGWWQRVGLLLALLAEEKRHGSGDGAARALEQ